MATRSITAFSVFICASLALVGLAVAFVPLSDGEAPKTRASSFGENSLSVNNDVVPDVDRPTAEQEDDDDDERNPLSIVLSSTDGATNIGASKYKIGQSNERPNAVREKMLFGHLSALKNEKYPLSMENYFYAWIDYKQQHTKKYDTFQEEKERFLIFVDNHEFVRRHNLAHGLGLKTFSVALNKFSDMSSEEFVKTVNGFKPKLRNTSRKVNSTKFMAPLNFQQPDQVDWRNEGYVTPVKDQGHCGSCWAFSATGALEGQHKRKLGKLVSLSEQNLVDCSFKFGNEGCNGGLMDNAFTYIKKNHGVDTEKGYPYEAKEGKCRFHTTDVGADDTGFFDIESGNETALAMAIASQGPVSVAIDAGHRSFQLYHKGVYFEPNCSSSALDHGVLAVGYASSEDGQDYWLVKNSWSEEWGEEGYIKMARNKDNHCGIATQASYPTV